MYRLFLILLLISAPTYAQSVDPTRPLIVGGTTQSAIKKSSALTLQSIIKSEQQPRVVINGKVLKKGEYVNQYQLITIGERQVTLASSEKEITLSLFSTVVTPVEEKDN